MKRVLAVDGVHPDIRGRAARIQMRCSDGTTEELEVGCDEMAVRNGDNGSARLLLRVGAHAFGVLFKERQSRAALARMLKA